MYITQIDKPSLITRYYASVKCSTKFKMFQLFVSLRLSFFSRFRYLHYINAVPSSGDSFPFQHSCWPVLLHFPRICIFPLVSSFSSFVTGPSLVSSPSSVAVELSSITGGRSSLSKSNTISGALLSPFLFCTFRLIGCTSLSLELVVPASIARLLFFFFSILSFCSSVEAATSLLKYTLRYLPFQGSWLLCGLTHSQPFRASSRSSKRCCSH